MFIKYNIKQITNDWNELYKWQNGFIYKNYNKINVIFNFFKFVI